MLQKYDEGAMWDGYFEPNDTWVTAHLLEDGRENGIQSTIYPRGAYTTNDHDQDYYRFSAELGHWYVIETYDVAPTLDTVMSLFDIDGTSEIETDYGDGKGNSDAQIVWQAPQTGIFYVKVMPYYATQEGTYSIRVLPKYDEGATWDEEWESDDTWVRSSPILLNQTQSRSIYQRGNYLTNNADYDYFWFAAQGGYEYTVDLLYVASTLEANLYILSLDGTTVLTSDTTSQPPGTLKSLKQTFYTSGIYYVLVRPYSQTSDNYGDYQLRISTSGSPELYTDKQGIRFVEQFGSTNSYPETLIIANPGIGTITWNATSNQDWINLNKNSGIVDFPEIIEVSVDIDSLSVGDYSGEIKISPENDEISPANIKVSLRIDPMIHPGAESEPNDTPSIASVSTIGWSSPIGARISTSSDIDWYKIDLQQDQWYVFEVNNVSPNLTPRLTLFDTDGSTDLKTDIYGNGSGDTYSRIVWQVPVNGTYYLKVSSNSGAGPYSIRVLQNYDEGATWDGYYEPNDTWVTAHLLEVGREYGIQSSIDPRGAYTTNDHDQDYYRFSAELGHFYVIDTFNVAPSLDTVMSLYDIDGTSEIETDYGDGKGNSDAQIVWQAPQTGIFYVKVVPYYATQEGLYSIRVLPKYNEGATWDEEWELDDAWVRANPILLNQTQSRSIYQRGNYHTNNADYDHFWFAAQEGYEYEVDLLYVASTLEADLYILSLDGTTVLTSDTTSQPPGTPKSIKYTFATPGIYYVLVRPHSNLSDNYGDYNLRVTSVIPAIHVNIEAISLEGVVNESSSQHTQLIISNSGFSSFNWELSVNENWLYADPTKGISPPDTTIDIWADIANMSIGTYTNKLTITASGIDNSPYIVPLIMEINDKYEAFIPVETFMP